MNEEALSEFAQLLVRKVRDEAIRAIDRRLIATPSSPIATRWRDAAAALQPADLIKYVAADIVDDALAHLLGAIDAEKLRLQFVSSSGSTLDLCTVAAEYGLLSGCYGGLDGWRETYSQERVAHDFDDLRGFFDPH